MAEQLSYLLYNRKYEEVINYVESIDIDGLNGLAFQVANRLLEDRLLIDAFGEIIKLERQISQKHAVYNFVLKDVIYYLYDVYDDCEGGKNDVSLGKTSYTTHYIIDITTELINKIKPESSSEHNPPIDVHYSEITWQVEYAYLCYYFDDTEEAIRRFENIIKYFKRYSHLASPDMPTNASLYTVHYHLGTIYQNMDKSKAFYHYYIYLLWCETFSDDKKELARIYLKISDLCPEANQLYYRQKSIETSLSMDVNK